MSFEHHWLSIQGSVTDNNRDYCGIAKKNGAALYVIVDGATSGPSGGNLARDLTHSLVDGFISIDDTDIEKQILELLRQAHQNLRHQYPADTASYLIVQHTIEGQISVYHAGDCRLGRVQEGRTIEWLTGVHTLANATHEVPDSELITNPGRHILTRSFRPRRLQNPDKRNFSLFAKDHLVIATDGFWAEISLDKQKELLKGTVDCNLKNRDDVSCLSLGGDGFGEVDSLGGGNIYIRSE